MEMNMENLDTKNLPLDVKAHIYQKLEEIKLFLAPGIQLYVKINPEAEEGFAIEYEVKTEGFALRSNASGENPFSVTNEATEDMVKKLNSIHSQVIKYLEDNNLINTEARVLH